MVQTDRAREVARFKGGCEFGNVYRHDLRIEMEIGGPQDETRGCEVLAQTV